MSIYIENQDKNVIQLQSEQSNVLLKVDCQHGTYAAVTDNYHPSNTVDCGNEMVIGKVAELKEKVLKFTGTSGNPSGDQIKIIHTIYEEGGIQINYTFPDDYSGTPDFDNEDSEPTYIFFVKFI